jgi:hypothetical protein
VVDLINTSFSGGEASPSFWGRTDEARFHVSASVIRNCFINFRGGVASRAGTAFVGPSKQPITGAPPRLITFRFNVTTDFELEFGDQYMRVIFQGAYVTETPIDLAGVTQANPGVVTTTIPHGYSNGDTVFVANVVGMTQINNRFFTVTGATATTFQLYDAPFNVPVSTLVFGAYVSGGSVARVYTVVSPYAAVDLPYLKTAQSADVMSLCCVNGQTGTEYPPYDLERFSDTDWEFVETEFAASIAAPASCSATATTTTPTPLTQFAYVVTAVSAATGEESQASPVANVESVDIAATAGSITVTWPAVAGAAFYNVYKAPAAFLATVPVGAQFGFAGSSFGTLFVDSNITQDFTTTPPLHLNPFARGQVIGANATAQGSGYAQATTTASVASATGTGLVILPVVVGGGVVAYVIQNPGQNYAPADAGNLVVTGGGTGAAATLVIGPQTGTYPSVVGYFQERRVYAGTLNNPDTYFMSQTGAYTNFDASSPPIDSDAITGTPWGQQVNGIQWLQNMPGGLIVATGLDAWQLTGTSGAGSPITPAQQSAQAQESNGFSPTLPLIKVNYDLLFVQSLGTIVRDLEYNFFVNIYAGQDISLYSNHLFENYQIVQWAWAKEPYKVVWATRNDGKLLSLTYVKEQKVYGWTRHDTNGAFLSVASASEPPIDAVYFVTQRYIPGKNASAYYVERMDSRLWQGPEDPWCIDAGLSLQQASPAASLSASSAAGIGTLVNPSVVVGGAGYTDPQIVAFDPSNPAVTVNGTATVAGGVITSWSVSGAGFASVQVRVSDLTGSGAVLSVGVQNLSTFVSNPGVFAPSSVGQVIRMDGGIATITQFLSSTQVVAQINNPLVLTVPNDPAGTPVVAQAGDWTLSTPASTLTNLDHLEGMTVSALADGNAYRGLTVQNGSITLPAPASDIKVGLPFVAQIQALHTDIQGGGTIQGKPKRVSGVTVRMEKSRGLMIGANQPIASALNFQQEEPWGATVPLRALQDRTTSMIYGQPIPLFTGDLYLPISDIWRPALNKESYGMVCAQQSDPLPMNLTAFIYSLEVAG